MRCSSSKSVIVLAASVALLVGLGGLWAAGEEEAAAVPSDIPDDAKKLPNPREATPQSISNGKQIYSSQCTMCHGATGDGKGDLAERFNYKMPDFTSSEVQSAWTDGALFYVLTHGHGKMSGEGDRLEADTRWDLVNYVRTLEKS